jgi:predicted N-acetyltransferase YhbS
VIVAELLPLAGVDDAEIEALLDAAFGTDRRGRTAYRLREAASLIDHLSFAISDAGKLLGSIQCWPVAVAQAPLILVGPVAVAPERQSEGHGKRLMQAMLAAVRPDDPPMVMIGDPEYYGRFGFAADGTSGWTLLGPWEAHRLLLRNPGGVALPAQGLLGPRPAL